MFRSVAHGTCLKAGKSAPSEHVQGELADDLRTKVYSSSSFFGFCFIYKKKRAYFTSDWLLILYIPFL